MAAGLIVQDTVTGPMASTLGQGAEVVAPSGDVSMDEDGAFTIGQVLDGANAANVAASNVIGGLEVLHRIDLAAGALAETDVVLTHKTRVIDAWLVLRGAGVSTTTVKVQNGATTITDAMAASGSDKALVRCATLDDAQWEIAAGGTLRVKSETGASQPACTVFVRGIRVA